MKHSFCCSWRGHAIFQRIKKYNCLFFIYRYYQENFPYKVNPTVTFTPVRMYTILHLKKVKFAFHVSKESFKQIRIHVQISIYVPAFYGDKSIYGFMYPVNNTNIPITGVHKYLIEHFNNVNTINFKQSDICMYVHMYYIYIYVVIKGSQKFLIAQTIKCLKLDDKSFLF